MLDLTSKSPTSSVMLGVERVAKTPSGPTLEDLRKHVARREDLADSTRQKWLRTIERVGRILNRPLDQIDASMDLVEVRFVPEWTDADEWPTERSYRDFRRILQSALREYLGVHAMRAELANRDDDWADLIAAVAPLTKGKLGHPTDGPRWQPMKLVGLKVLAHAARRLHVQPRGLDVSTCNLIVASSSGNERGSIIRAMRRIDELFAFDDLLPFLPAKPIAFTPDILAPALCALPEQWEACIAVWVLAVTHTSWDPVAQDYSDKHDKHAHVLRSALRTTARIAVELGLCRPEDDIDQLLRDDAALTQIAREMFARKDRPKRDGRLKPRTSRKYLKGVNQVRAHLGIDTSLLTQILQNNKDARQGGKDDKEMTAENRKFCQDLIDSAKLRRKFFLSHRVLQDEANRIIGIAKSEGRDMTRSEVAEVRRLGVVACFAAIEIGGAPIRTSNAITLTSVGSDARIRVPKSARKPIKTYIPAARTKNKRTIEFEIKPSRHQFHDVIRWYIDVIRPLFPHATQSRYLFPSLRGEIGHISKSYFAECFKTLMRSVVALPMRPHQMRHGQTSLLLDRHPNEVEVIASRIGDHAETLRKYYGWMNALKLVERGQDLIAGLIDG